MAYDFRYIHYWQEHIPEEAWSNQIWYDTKIDILRKHISDLAKRQRKVLQIAKEKNIDEEAISQFISGEILQGISKIKQTDYQSNERTENSKLALDPRAIITNLKTQVLTFDDIEKFVDTMNNYLESLSNETQGMLNEYVESILLRVTGGSILKQSDLSSYSSAGKVLAALMGKYSEDSFKIPDNAYEQYNTSMGKVALAARLIPLCQEELQSGMIVRHGDRKDGKVRKDIFLLEEVRKKCIAWLRDADKTLKEVSEGAGIVQVHLIGLEAIQGLDINIEHTGNNYYSVNTNLDSEIKEIVTELKQKQIYYKKKAKKDFSIDFSDEGGHIVLSLGANAKNYEKALTDGLQSYSIKIQDGTPMSTLLEREAGFTGEELWAALQVASGVSRNNDYNLADEKWSFLVKSIGYRGLLNALAGFAETKDQSFYMVINGNFWTMLDFIQHFIDSSSSVGLSEIKPDTGNKSYGLIRSTYSDLNKKLWEEDLEKDGVMDNAQNRSTRLWKESMNIMYNTKIRVEITLREISRLMQLVL